MTKDKAVNSSEVNGDENASVEETAVLDTPKNSVVAIRGSVHPLIHERVIKAEHAMRIKDRGVILDMALRTFFALSPAERAKALDEAIEERSKLDTRVVVTERDFNF